MTRPWPSIRIGWILALMVLILAVLHFVGVALPAEAVWVAITLIALALLV